MPKEKKVVKGKSFSKGKKFPRNSKKVGDEDTVKGFQNDNDVSWYVKYPALVKATSSIIFNHRYGTPYDVAPNVTFKTPPVSTLHKRNNIAGALKVSFRMALAGDGSDLDPVNVCAKNLYTYIRHANSGAANYESSDMMQYVISVLGLQTRLEQLKRDLRLCMTYNPLNRYVYRTLLKTRGYTDTNIDIMVADNALYVGRINALIAQLNTFKIPKEFSVFDKFSWLVTNVFRDDDLSKASYYFYATDDLVHYDWANRKVTMTRSTVGTFDAELSKVQSEINNLLAYEDIGIMIGDILKAYKAEGCRVWAPMNLGEVQDSSYSSEVLEQMVNTVAVPVTGVLTIEQINANTQLLGLKQGSGNYGVFKATISESSLTGSWIQSAANFNPELVMYNDQPASDEVITATRNTIAGQIQDNSTNGIDLEITEYPNNICESFTIAYFDASGILQQKVFYSLWFYDSNDVVNQNEIISKAYALSKFPTLYRWYDDSGDLYHDVYAYGKNNLVVSREWIKRLHEGCKMSELTLPMFKLLESN